MVVKVPQHKGDQTGESLSMDKHVYANPLEPKICTILSLAVFFFCRKRFKRNGQIKCKLFTDDRKDRFGYLLEVILNDKSLVPDNHGKTWAPAKKILVCTATGKAQHLTCVVFL